MTDFETERASKGGRARAAALTAEQRSASARKAARARWARKPHIEESWTSNSAPVFVITLAESYTAVGQEEADQ